MRHLRRKLEKGRKGARVFETEAGVGYRLLWAAERRPYGSAETGVKALAVRRSPGLTSSSWRGR